MASVYINAFLCKCFWKLSCTRLRRHSSIAATWSRMTCLSSWMIRLWNTRVSKALIGKSLVNSGHVRWSRPLKWRSCDLSFRRNCLDSTITRPECTRLFPNGAFERSCDVFQRRSMSIQELKQDIVDDVNYQKRLQECIVVNGQRWPSSRCNLRNSITFKCLLRKWHTWLY